jgi:hypothetical protein
MNPQKTKRLTRAHIQARMWAGGRPSTEGRYSKLFFVARKAGLNDAQAFALTCAAFDAAKGSHRGLSSTTQLLRLTTLERMAEAHPCGLIAYLRAKLGVGFRYVTDAEIADTSMNHFPEWKAWADTLDQQAVRS